ncbi:MAG: ABC transporter permease [Mycoplasmatales bacterium]
MKRRLINISVVVYFLLTTIIPLVLIGYKSITNGDGEFSISNFTYIFQGTYIKIFYDTVIYSVLITIFTLVIGYPFAYIISRMKYRNEIILLILCTTWVNILLKIYSWIGLLSIQGTIAQGYLSIFPNSEGILYTDLSFFIVSIYVYLPIMIVTLYHSIVGIDEKYIFAAKDLGADERTIFRRIIFPNTISGVINGIQFVFIPSMTLFMLNRLIAGNKVVTLGSIIEQQFLSNNNYGIGAALVIIVMIFFALVSFITNKLKHSGSEIDELEVEAGDL